MLSASSFRLSQQLCLIAAIVLAAALPTSAVPYVVTGSTYKANLIQFNNQARNLNQAIVTFDGNAEVFPLAAGGSVTITESETYLGSGSSKIDITLLGTAELFPLSLTPISPLAGGVQIGATGDPLNFTQPIRLLSATVTHTQGNGNVILPATQMIGNMTQINPWDGFYAGSSSVIVFSQMIGQDVRRIDLSFIVQAPIPEPATATLGLIGLGGLMVRRRRMA